MTVFYVVFSLSNIPPNHYAKYQVKNLEVFAAVTALKQWMYHFGYILFKGQPSHERKRCQCWRFGRPPGPGYNPPCWPESAAQNRLAYHGNIFTPEGREWKPFLVCPADHLKHWMVFLRIFVFLRGFQEPWLPMTSMNVGLFASHGASRLCCHRWDYYRSPCHRSHTQISLTQSSRRNVLTPFLILCEETLVHKRKASMESRLGFKSKYMSSSPSQSFSLSQTCVRSVSYCSPGDTLRVPEPPVNGWPRTQWMRKSHLGQEHPGTSPMGQCICPPQDLSLFTVTVS